MISRARGNPVRGFTILLISLYGIKMEKNYLASFHDLCLPSLLASHPLTHSLLSNVQLKILYNSINPLLYRLFLDHLFDLILYVPSTIFQLNRDGSSCVEPVLS